MFTGLIEDLGTVISVRRTGNGSRLCLKPDSEMQLQTGESISVNGVCLTVSELRTENLEIRTRNLKLGNQNSELKTPNSPASSRRFGTGPAELYFDVSPETLKSTNLGELKINDRVNIERALRLSDRLGGHIVTGHVDGVGYIRGKKREGEYTFYTFEPPAGVLKYLVKKGSIAVDGISLTVVDIAGNSFRTAIIPHTLNVTNLGFKGVGDKVNLEADIIGKYVEKFLGIGEKESGLMTALMQGGYIK
ncbi:MAG: riboflavin synthase [Nitrospirae bacterium]|nr:riboflavin synthase [Nitrospirota bacterium]